MNKKLFLTLAFAAGLFAISHMSDLTSVATIANNDVEEEMIISENDTDMEGMVVSNNDAEEEMVMSENDGEDLTLACGDDFFGDEEVHADADCEECLTLAMVDDNVDFEDLNA